MTPTLIALALLSPIGVHSTTDAPTTEAPSTSTTDDGWLDKDKFEQCELFGYRAYAHRVHTGDMDPGMWDDLVGNGWTIQFVGPTSPVLTSPICALD